MLSHDTAGWWWLLLPGEPEVIHLSTLGKRRSVGGLMVHGRRSIERVVHRGLPVTDPSQTLLDVASVLPSADLRRALSEADYRRLIDREKLVNSLGPGVPGSAAMRRAMQRHLPELARTRSILEERFLEMCQTSALPLPQVNAVVSKMTVDALWPDARVVVELDGHAAHAGPARAEQDRRRELRLRSYGYDVRRYTWHQITKDSTAVVADLRRAVGPASP